MTQPTTDCFLKPTSMRAWAGAAWVVITALSAGADESSTNDFFEQQIRPLLVESCVECHSDSEQSGGIRLDSR